MAILRESPENVDGSSPGEHYVPQRIVLDGAGERLEPIDGNGFPVRSKQRGWPLLAVGRARTGNLLAAGRHQARRLGAFGINRLRAGRSALSWRERLQLAARLGRGAALGSRRHLGRAFSVLAGQRPLVESVGRALAVAFAAAMEGAVSLGSRLHRALLVVWPKLQSSARWLGNAGRPVAVQCVILLMLGLHAVSIAAQMCWRSFLLATTHAQALVRAAAQPAQAESYDLGPGTYPTHGQRPRRAGRCFNVSSVAIVPLAASSVVALVAIQFYGSILPSLVRGLRPADVPILTGRTLDEATEAARIQGLGVTVASVRPSDSSQKNIVVEQAPVPGTLMRRGDVVKLTVSAGLRPPNVIGKPLDQARVQLVRDGWSVAPEVETRIVNGPSDVVIEQHPGPEEAQQDKGPVKLAVAAANLAQGRSVLKNVGGLADQAVDGQPETVAWVPGGLPNWVEIDLGGPVNVAAFSLLLAQERPGPSVIEVWAWDASNRFAPLQLFSQETSDNAVLSARLAQPATNVVRLRVVTSTAPSPIGWREITVTDR